MNLDGHCVWKKAFATNTALLVLMNARELIREWIAVSLFSLLLQLPLPHQNVLLVTGGQAT